MMILDSGLLFLGQPVHCSNFLGTPENEFELRDYMKRHALSKLPTCISQNRVSEH